MLAATIAETIVGSVIMASLLAFLGAVIAMGWLVRFPRALARIDAWAFAHPWSYAAIVATASSFPIALVIALVRAPLLLAFLVLGLWFWFIGWSMSSGPGRRRHDRQMRGGSY